MFVEGGRVCHGTMAQWPVHAWPMLTNSRDAFRGQSTSPNMEPFDILGIWFPVVTLSLRRTAPFVRYSTCNNTVTLKPGLGVTQGHQNRHVSIRHLWLPINVTKRNLTRLNCFNSCYSLLWGSWTRGATAVCGGTMSPHFWDQRGTGGGQSNENNLCFYVY